MGRNMIAIHSPTGAAIFSTVISPERYEWLHAAHSHLNHPKVFTRDLLKQMFRYHPSSKSLNPQRRPLKLANHWAMSPSIRQAIENTFLTTMELFGSSLICSISQNITYCIAFQADKVFGSIINGFLFQWINSCIATPECEPEDILKAVLHALASSVCTELPLLIIMILLVWEDSPWNSVTIRGHGNM